MPEKEKDRNIFVYDCEGKIISGFWQYGLINWEELSRILINIISTEEQWAFFYLMEYGIGDKVPNNSTEIVPEGNYVILTSDGMPLKVEFQNVKARPRNPPTQTVESRRLFYRERTRERDPYCLITKLPHGGNFQRFDAAHIFPRVHQQEWLDRHFSGKITDPAPDNEVGGPSKIDSIQNVILLRKDLHSAWDSYCFGVNPDRNYIVVPFTKGYDDIAGKTLGLDHIQDPNLRPLDDLFRDHFLQGIFKYMKGAGEPSWDHENTPGPGALDLSQWTFGEQEQRVAIGACIS